MPDSQVAPDVLVLLVRDGCHLCDVARAVLADECSAAGAGWVEWDVDADAELADRYGQLVPALLVAGQLTEYWRFDRDQVRRHAAAAAQSARIRSNEGHSAGT